MAEGAGRRRGVATVPAAAGLVLLVVGCAGCSAGSGNGAPASSSARASSSVDDSYGALPSFLPTVTNQADSVVTGAPGHPAVTAQGEPVLARLGHGTVRVQVAGPVVPGEGLPHVADATTCTWTVTVDRASAPVPIRLGDFVTVDEDGHAYRLQFAPGTARPPAVLATGRSAVFRLRTVMATGEGVLRWQPAGHALAVWDFVVEND